MKKKKFKFFLWKIIVLAIHGVNVFPPIISLFLYRLFIASNGSLPRVSQYFYPQLSGAKEDVMQNFIIRNLEEKWVLSSL